MRIEELSVGDFLFFTDGDCTVCVQEIYNDAQLLISDGDSISEPVHITHLRPIPLTPEILEKNGLMRVSEEKGYEAYCCNDFLIRRSKFSCTDWWQVDVHYKQYVAHLSGYIQYVHQLQHLLAINECDKKIEL